MLIETCCEKLHKGLQGYYTNIYANNPIIVWIARQLKGKSRQILSVMGAFFLNFHLYIDQNKF